MGFSDQLSTIVFVLLVVQITKHFDLAKPENIWYVRFSYTMAQSILFASAYYVYNRIKKLRDPTKIQVTEPAKPFSSEPPTILEMTIEEYDLLKIKEFAKQSLISLLILGFLHYKYEFIQPLLIQSILPLKAAFSLPIFQIHLFKKAATGDLKRPFKAPSNPFSEMLESAKEEEPSKKEKKKLLKAATATAAASAAAEQKED